jgi:hypothetical protein
VAVRFARPAGNDSTGDGLTLGTRWLTTDKANLAAKGAGGNVKVSDGSYTASTAGLLDYGSVA